MKNITLKFSLTILASAILTACGSSGGNSSDNSAKNTAKPVQTETAKPTEQAKPAQNEAAKPAEQANPTPAETAKPAEQAKPVPTETTKPADKPKPIDNATNSKIKPAKRAPNLVGFTHSKNGGTLNSITIDPSNENLEKIGVENQIIPLIPNGFSGDIIQIINKKEAHIAGVGYNNVRWLYLAQESLNNKYLMSYGINMTSENNIPTNGKIKYSGNGIHLYGKDVSNSVDTTVLTNVTLEADFDKKEIYGEVKSNSKDYSFKPVTLGAQIVGNTFSGIFDSSRTQGAFYGKNADEIAGQYVSQPNAKPYAGVFAAKKK